MSRTPKLAAVAVLAAFSGLALQVQAQETVELDEVKVTAGRVEQELMDVNMSVSVITQEEIRRSSARNVGELLEDIPGVRINNDGGQGMKRIKIRGEDAFRTLVMIDGQKVSEHKSMSGSPMLIDPSMIERIEVIKGPASVLYGSGAADHWRRHQHHHEKGRYEADRRRGIGRHEYFGFWEERLGFDLRRN